MKPSVYDLLDALRSNADGCDAVLQNRLLNIASAIHTEYDLRLNEIEALQAKVDNLQLHTKEIISATLAKCHKEIRAQAVEDYKKSDEFAKEHDRIYRNGFSGGWSAAMVECEKADIHNKKVKRKMEDRQAAKGDE